MASTPTAPAQRPALVDHRCPACGRLLLRARLPVGSQVEIRCRLCKATVEARLTRARLAESDQDAARKRGRRNSATLRASAAWEREQASDFDPGTFARGIGPKLSAVSLAAMMRATALSRPYCAMIRRGERVPHPRHWEGLRTLRS